MGMDSKPKQPMEQHKAFYTVEQSEVGNLYYFSPLVRAPGPYRQQRHVEAIIDIDADGNLAGVELIDTMPPPPLSSRR